MFRKKTLARAAVLVVRQDAHIVFVDIISPNIALSSIVVEDG
jgi:hypothetical protein